MSTPYEGKYPNKIKPELKMSSRLGAFPIDASSVFNTKEELMSYILAEGSNAYAGQIVAVANGTIETSNGNKDYTRYIIRSNKTIQEVRSNEIFESIAEANAYISTNYSSVSPGQVIAIFNGTAYDTYTITKDKAIRRSSFNAETDMIWDKVLGKPANIVNTLKTTSTPASVTINATAKNGDIVVGDAAAKTVSTNIPVAPTEEQNASLPTLSAVKAYADSILGANDAMLFKGTISGAAPGLSWTPAAVVGDTYKVSAAGDINLLTLEIGDMLICTADTIAANQDNVGTIRNNWVIVQSNIDGAVTGPPSSTGDAIPIFVGNSGKVVQDSGYTIGADGALNGEEGRKTIATETAVKAYADSILGTNSALFFKGTLVYTEADDSSMYGALTPMAEKGWVYLVVAQNTETWERNIGDYAYINDMDSTIGSLLVCINNTDAATEETVDSIALNWAYIPANIPPFKNMVMYSENPVNIKPGLIQPIDQMTIDDYLSNFPSETDAINYLVSHGAPAAIINRNKGEHAYLNALGDWDYIRGNDIRDASIDLATKCSGQSPNTFIMTNSDPSAIDSYAYDAKEVSIDTVKSILGVDTALVIKGQLDACAKTEASPYGIYTPAAKKGDAYVINNTNSPGVGYINGLPVSTNDSIICIADTADAATAETYSSVTSSWIILYANQYIGVFGVGPNQNYETEFGHEWQYKSGLVPYFAYSTDIDQQEHKDAEYILKGDGTWSRINTTMFDAHVVTNEKLANMPTKTIKGNNTEIAGTAKDLTPTEVRALINVADGANNYVHPITTAATASMVKIGRDSEGHVVIGNPITGSDITNLGITAGLAVKLQTPRKINGTDFDGSIDITITDSTKVPLKPMNNFINDYEDFVIPLISLDNTDTQANEYFMGKIILKRGNGNGLLYEVIDVSAIKKYNSTDAAFYLGKTSMPYKVKPVTFTHNSIKYFGIYVQGVGSNLDKNFAQGVASDFSIIDTIPIYNTNTLTIVNSEIYSSLYVCPDDGNRQSYEFTKTPYVTDNNDNRYKMWHAGNDGTGSGLDADTLDGKQASEFLSVADKLVSGTVVLSESASVITIPIVISDVANLSVYQNGLLLSKDINYTATTTQITLTAYTANSGDIFVFIGTSGTSTSIQQKSDHVDLSDTTNFPQSTTVQEALDLIKTTQDSISTPVATYIHDSNPEIYVTAVDVDTNTFTAVGHGLSNGDTIYPILNQDAGSVYPIAVYAGGLTKTTNGYYVINSTTNTFQLAITSGGSSIDLTTNTGVDLTKWHFEKSSVNASFAITNLLPRKKYKIEITGRNLSYNIGTYILPNELTLGSDWINSAYGDYNYPEIANFGDVFCKWEAIIDFSKYISLDAKGLKCYSNTITTNTSAYSMKSLVNLNHSNSDITSLRFLSHNPANGYRVEVYAI